MMCRLIMCTRAHVCLWLRTCAHVHVSVCARVHACVCLCVCVPACVFMCVPACTRAQRVCVSAKPWNMVSREALLWAETGDETACHLSYVTETCAEHRGQIYYDTLSFLNMPQSSGIITQRELLFIV